MRKKTLQEAASDLGDACREWYQVLINETGFKKFMDSALDWLLKKIG